MLRSAAAASGRQRLLCVLAFGLLAVQAAVPWAASHYVSQDGPSHIYTANVFRNLMLHPHGLYASTYRIQPRLVTEWATMLLLSVLIPVAGVAHAEACLDSILVIAGFICISYFRRSLSPASSIYDPLTNFLLNAWFLWTGYYNFYLGMAICLLVIGFYIRRAEAITRSIAVKIAVALLVLFFVHVMPCALAMLGIGAVALWNHARKPRMASLLLTCASFVPALVLLFFFLRHRSGGIQLSLPTFQSVREFPLQAFANARGWAGEESLLVPVVLIYALIGIAAMKRSEWFSPRPALLVAALVTFAGYLVFPDHGFGGSDLRVRLAWSTLLFALTVASSVERLALIQIPLSIYTALFIALSLRVEAGNLENFNRAASVYASAIEGMPEGSRFVRLHYGTPKTREKFGYDLMAMEPLFHTDAWVASDRRYIDLTDAWALSRLFPVSFNKTVTGEQQNWLYEMEDGDSHGNSPLLHILNSAVPFDYVVITGETGGSNGFVHLYKREDLKAGNVPGPPAARAP